MNTKKRVRLDQFKQLYDNNITMYLSAVAVADIYKMLYTVCCGGEIFEIIHVTFWGFTIQIWTHTYSIYLNQISDATHISIIIFYSKFLFYSNSIGKGSFIPWRQCNVNKILIVCCLHLRIKTKNRTNRTV